MNFILVDELTINYSIANRFNRIMLIMVILEPFNHDEMSFNCKHEIITG